jgi:hypothetical protein
MMNISWNLQLITHSHLIAISSEPSMAIINTAKQDLGNGILEHIIWPDPYIDNPLAQKRIAHTQLTEFKLGNHFSSLYE